MVAKSSRVRRADTPDDSRAAMLAARVQIPRQRGAMSGGRCGVAPLRRLSASPLETEAPRWHRDRPARSVNTSCFIYVEHI